MEKEKKRSVLSEGKKEGVDPADLTAAVMSPSRRLL